MNLGIIGIGRLGLSFALLCEKKGYHVIGSDVNEEYVKSLNDKSFTSIEPHIQEYLLSSRNFKATTSNKEVVSSADIIFLFVPTPSTYTGEYDHQYIEQVLSELETMPHAGYKQLVIGCTVMPGYTRSIAERMDKVGYSVSYNPEFIAQGDIVNGLRKADMILIGSDSEAAIVSLTSIYRTIMDKEPVINAMSPTAAEITKISINCYLTTKISFANMIGEIAINSGVESEIKTILQAIGDDSRIGRKYLNYGFGFGGVCLPRDNRALAIHARNVGAADYIPETIDEFNEQHAQFLKDYYMRVNPDKDYPFAFTQLSYKKGVSILTESQQYRLCRHLLDAGYKVNISEIPEVMWEILGPLKESYGDRVNFFGQDTIPEGYLINL